jgi:predicted nucleic acid-binding protein
MILADTSVWIDHLRRGDPVLSSLLAEGDVYCHSFIIGELACGNLTSRKEILHWLGLLPAATLVRHAEVLGFIEAHRLSGLGLGFIDAHILASASLEGLRLWTRDKALRKAAEALRIAY